MILTIVSLSLLSSFVVAQDGCERSGCGGGECSVVRPETYFRRRGGGVRLAYPELRRCRSCPDGWTGLGCARPCQNMYKQCTQRWAEERRCQRHRHKTAYFDDNCPLSCGHCTPGQFKLETPIPILAEPLAWLMGRWESHTADGRRWPLDLPGPFRQVLIIKPEKITMFDRPSLNISATATLLSDPDNVFQDVGFMTSRFGNEDSGYVRNKHSVPEALRDIGMSWSSNTGVSWVEEGRMDEQTISLKVVWGYSFAQNIPARNATRRFSVADGVLTEEVAVDGTPPFSIDYRRTFDFLAPIPKTRDDLEDPDF